ncbi:MAG: preprotein translocase subunit SecE [candidate division WWE3 bacterium]|nr:preprotein translocase subunit SecE [candidate division WWE3 bacterium]
MNIITKAKQFLIEARDELKKVIWPSRRQLLKLSGIVIGVSIVIGFYLGGLDALLGQALKLAINK